MSDSELQTSTRPATDADIADFMNAEAPAWQDGTRYDVEQRGVFTRDEPTPLVHGNEPAPPTDPSFVDVRDDAGHWRSQYGRSENEKGELRRALESQQSTIARLDAELAALRAAQANAPSAPPNAPQYTPQYQQPQLPATYFPDKQEGDFLEVREVDALLRNVIAPAVQGVWAEQIRMQQAQVEVAKRNAGITPTVEQGLRAKYPWLNSITDPSAQVQSMVSLIEASKPATPPSARPADPAAAAAVRRYAYVEPSATSATSRDDGIPVEQRMAQEFAAARTAAEKKAVLIKYGAQQVNDWGPNILTR